MRSVQTSPGSFTPGYVDLMGPTSVRNWSGNVTFGARAVHRPVSMAELSSVVAASSTCRALGTAHSFSTVADTPGDLVSLAHMPRRIDIDPTSSTVTVNSGLRFGELAPVLHAEGLALHNLGSLPHISVGGASATGTHGSGDANGCLATSVRAVEIVTADGDVVRVSDEDPSFPGVPVSLGTLGIISALTLTVQPTFAMRQHVYEAMDFQAALEHLDGVLASAYSVSLFTTWREPVFDEVWVKQRLDRPEGEGPTAHEWLGARLAAGPCHPVPTMDPLVCTQQLDVPGPWHERLPHFRLDFTPSAGDELQTEYLVDRRLAADALRALSEVRSSIAAVLHVGEIRSIAGDQLWLSPAFGRDSVAIHFTWISDTTAVMPVVALVEEVLAPFSPRPHWGKVFSLLPDVVAAQYPHLHDAVRLADRFDPAGKFRNPFTDRYLRG